MNAARKRLLQTSEREEVREGDVIDNEHTTARRETGGFVATFERALARAERNEDTPPQAQWSLAGGTTRQILDDQPAPCVAQHSSSHHRRRLVEPGLIFNARASRPEGSRSAKEERRGG